MYEHCVTPQALGKGAVSSGGKPASRGSCKGNGGIKSMVDVNTI